MKYRWPLTYDGLTHGFLTLRGCERDMYSAENTLGALNLAIFLARMAHGRTLSLGLGSQSPSVCLSLSVQYSINVTRYSSHYKTC